MTFLTGAMNYYFVNSLVCNKLSSQVIKIQLHGSLSFHLSTRFSTIGKKRNKKNEKLE